MTSDEVGTMLLLARKPEQLEFQPFDLCVLARREEVRSGNAFEEACHLFQSVATTG